MPVVVVTEPQYPVVLLDEVKVHLRVDHDDDDDYIEGLVAVATASIDGPGGWLGRALGEQVLEWRGDDFGCVDLIYTPVTEIVGIFYDDTNGNQQTLASDTWRLIGLPESPMLRLAAGKSWPSVSPAGEAVRIQYSAGWPFDVEGAGAEEVVTWTGPKPIRHAILMMVAEFYENREAATDAPRVELPFAVTVLLSPYRRFL